MIPVHRLSDKDTTARKAECSVCGPVKILPAGRGWVCATKKLQRKREWAASNPDRVAASRATPGAHRLISRDGRLGVCTVCGPVAAVPWGRGYTCENRASQLRRIQQDKPAERCRDCRGWFNELDAGRCSPCALLATPHQSLNVWLPDIPQWEPMVDLLIRSDLSEPGDDRRDRTNPSLKVIGDRNVPPEWRWAMEPFPDWGRLDSMSAMERT